MKKEEQHLFIIPCPPIKDFPEAPEDQPSSEIVKCKHCDKGMWLSKKKRLLIMEKPDAFVSCWHCLLDMAEKGEMKFEKMIRVNI